LTSSTYFTNTLIYVYICSYFIRTYFSIHLRIIKEIYVLSIHVRSLQRDIRIVDLGTYFRRDVRRVAGECARGGGRGRGGGDGAH
jgi:hypothetical protein